MNALNLPYFPLKIKKVEEKHFVWDILRKKYIQITPEEWVRQHFVHFLIERKGYPKGLLANEVQVLLNGQKKRCDTILYSKTQEPFMIIEYKAPDVPITQKVFDQITRYNIALKVRYLIVSNGIEHFCCEVDYLQHNYRFLPEIPFYHSLPEENL